MCFRISFPIPIIEFDISLRCTLSSPGLKMQCGLKFTGISLQPFQDKELNLLLENHIRRGRSSIMGDRYVKSDQNKNYYLLTQTTYTVTH